MKSRTKKITGICILLLITFIALLIFIKPVEGEGTIIAPEEGDVQNDWWYIEQLGDEYILHVTGQMPSTYNNTAPWNKTNGDARYKHLGEMVTKAVAEEGSASNANMQDAFKNMTNLVELDLRGMDFSATTNISFFCDQDKKLEKVNLSGLDMSNVNTNTNGEVFRDSNPKELIAEGTKFSSVAFNGFKKSTYTNIDLKNADLSVFTSLQDCFKGWTNLLTVDLSGANMSKAASVCAMFMNCSNLTSVSLENADISIVTNVGNMFENCSKLTSVDLDNANLSKATALNKMFRNCDALTSITMENTVLTSVKILEYMFCSCDQLETADLSKITLPAATSIACMFQDCKSLTAVKLPADLHTVTTANALFENDVLLTEVDLSGNDFSGLTSMPYMFKNCTGLVSPEDGSTFPVKLPADLSKVTNANELFYGCTGLKSLDLSGIDLQKVSSYSNILYNVTPQIVKLNKTKISNKGFLQTLANSCSTLEAKEADFSGITNVNELFNNKANLINIDLTGVDFPGVTGEAGYMFANCKNLESVTLDNVNLSKATNSQYMFYNCPKLINVSLDNLDVSAATNCSQWFNACSTIESIDMSTVKMPNNMYINQMFYNCKMLKTAILPKDLSKVTNANYLFFGCESLPAMDLSEIDLSSVTTIHRMFAGCYGLDSGEAGSVYPVKLPKNMSKVANISYMFEKAINNKILDISGVDLSSVTNADSMYNGCTGPQTVIMDEAKMPSGIGAFKAIINNCEVLSAKNTDFTKMTSASDFASAKTSLITADLTNARFDNTTTINWMFKNCTKLESVTLAGAQMSAVKSAREAFASCASLRSVVLSDNFESLTDMNRMFADSKGLVNVDISNMVVPKVTTIAEIFRNDTSLVSASLPNFTVLTNMSYAFEGCTSLMSFDGSCFAGNQSASVSYENAFNNCTALTELNLADLSSKTAYSNLFTNCGAATETGTRITLGPNLNLNDNCGWAYNSNYYWVVTDENDANNTSEKAYIASKAGFAIFKTDKAVSDAAGVPTTIVPASKIIFTANSDTQNSDPTVTDDSGYSNGAYIDSNYVKYRFQYMGTPVEGTLPEVKTTAQEAEFTGWAESTKGDLVEVTGKVACCRNALPTTGDIVYYAQYKDSGASKFDLKLKFKVSVDNSSYETSIPAADFQIYVKGVHDADNAVFATNPYYVEVHTPESEDGQTVVTESSIGTMTFINAGTYNYTIQQMDVPTRFRVDTTEHTLQVVVANHESGEGFVISKIILDEEDVTDQPEIALEFNNSYMSESYTINDALFFNYYGYSNVWLQIRSNVVGEKNCKYEFKYKVESLDENLLPDPEGSEYEISEDKKTITFSMIGDNSKTIDDIVHSTLLKVTETDHNGYTVTYYIDDGEVLSGDTVPSVLMSGNRVVNFVNKRKNGCISVSKVVTDKSTTQAFPFEATVLDENGNPAMLQNFISALPEGCTYKPTWEPETDPEIIKTLPHYVILFNLADGDSISDLQIPTGYSVTVQETEHTNYSVSYTVGATTTEGDTYSFTVDGENKDILFANAKALADLTISKTADETFYADDSFVYHVVSEKTVGDVPVTDMYITLKAGESVTLKNFEVGNYTITEEQTWSWRYKLDEITSEQMVSQTDTSAVIALGANGAAVNFNNELTFFQWITGVADTKNNNETAAGFFGWLFGLGN